MTSKKCLALLCIFCFLNLLSTTFCETSSELLEPWSIFYANGVAHSLVQTSDGGFAIAGGEKIHTPPLVIKISVSGKEEWRTNWGPT